MTRNRKGRAGWHQATLKTSTSTYYSTGLTAHIKGLIITLALWGWRPLRSTDRLLTHRGEGCTMLDALSNFHDVVTVPICTHSHRLPSNWVNQGGTGHG